jgi:hypothetical protein
MIIPLVGALYGWRSTPASGWLSIILGGSSSLAWQLLLHEPAGVPAILIGLVGSMIGFLLGRLVNTSVKAVASQEAAL